MNSDNHCIFSGLSTILILKRKQERMTEYSQANRDTYLEKHMRLGKDICLPRLLGQT